MILTEFLILRLLVDGFIKFVAYVMAGCAAIVLAFFILKQALKGLGKLLAYLFKKAGKAASDRKNAMERRESDMKHDDIMLAYKYCNLNSLMTARGVAKGDLIGEDDYAFMTENLYAKACDSIKTDVTTDSIRVSSENAVVLLEKFLEFRTGQSRYKSAYDCDISQICGVKGYSQKEERVYRSCFEILEKRKRGRLKADEYRKQLAFIKGELDKFLYLPGYAAKALNSINGSERIFVWLKTAKDSDLAFACTGLCNMAERDLARGYLYESAALLREAYSLILSAYGDAWVTTSVPELIKMLERLKEKGMITEDIFARKRSLVRSLDTLDHVASGELIADALKAVRNEAVTAFCTVAEIHAPTIRDEYSAAQEAKAQERESAERQQANVPENTEKDALAVFISRAEDAYNRKDFLNAAVQGRYFLEKILKEYCEAVSLDRAGMGLMEQIDYFRAHEMLQEIECSHLHAIRMVSNKGAHYDESITADEVRNMLRHMKAELRLFGVD